MRIQSKGTIFEGVEVGINTLSCFPSYCRLSNGDILASFQCGPAKNHAESTVFMCRTSDGGRSWSKPEKPFYQWASSQGLTVHVGYMKEVSPGRLLANLMLCDHMGNPDLPFFHPQTGGALPISIGLSESLDAGRTWSIPRIINAGRFNDVPVPVMSPIVRTRGGELLLPFETSKNYHDTGVWKHNAACLMSRDDGKTWDDVIVIAHDDTNQLLFFDHRTVALDDGHIIDFFWTFDATGKELTAHRSVSQNGVVWPNTLFDTGLVGQPWPIPLDGNSLLVLTVDRYGDRAIKATMTDDLGKTWGEELTIYKHPIESRAQQSMADATNDMQLWSFGLPSGIRLPANEVLVTWYCGSPEKTQIEWARVQLQLHCCPRPAD